MSGTNTNIEMDDVLSSIRRLVSEEDEKLPVPEPDVQDRFILTPALRVTDVVAAPDKAESAVPADDTPSTVESAEPTEVLTAAAVVAKATEVQQDTLKIPPAPEKSDSPEFDAMEEAWREELTRVAATQESGNEENDQARSEEAGDTSLEAQIAELEDAVGQAKDDWEPDGSEPEAKEIPRRHIFEVVSDTDDVTDEISEDQADEQIPVFAHTSEPHPKPYLLSASDPEQGGGDEAQLESPNSVEADEGVITPSDVVEDDDVFLDVEALRSMITEVVREELHGKLGETITRNVRKMIQHEIGQALTDQRPEDDI